MGDTRAEFTFHQCLGKGGFGEVYLATVTRPGGLARKVAVKVLKQGLPDEGEAVRRLRDEGRMLAYLNHPAILRVDDLVRVDGRLALITEYIEGIDLARCARRPELLPRRVALEAVGQVADALHCAWSTPSPETGRPLQLVHRDLKPENIRVSVHGQVKLLDFGIARSTEMVRNAKTVAGDVPFTPGYAAPEAFSRGEQGTPGDIYALGATLYRLLQGERFHRSKKLEDQLLIAAFPDRYRLYVRERVTALAVPRPVSELVLQMLCFEPEERPGAEVVRERTLILAESLGGESLIRWARRTDFPPPRSIKGASLTGRTLVEDLLDIPAEPPLHTPRAAPALRVPQVAAPTSTPVGPPPVPTKLQGRTPVSPPRATGALSAQASAPPAPPRPVPTATPPPLPRGFSTVRPESQLQVGEINITAEHVPPPPEPLPEPVRRGPVVLILALLVVLGIMIAVLAAVLAMAL